MLEYKGKYNDLKVFIDEIDETTVAQLFRMLNNPAFADTKIRIMPDTHAGSGSVIGFTMNIKDKIIPNIVGVDIGCGVLAVSLGKIDIDYAKLDEAIRKYVPAGFDIHDDVRKNTKDMSKELIDKFCKLAVSVGQDENKCLNSIGSLGGGNHFIEVNENDDGVKYLCIHTGSRNLGLRVCEHHQKIAKAVCTHADNGLEYLEVEKEGRDYLNDMLIAQTYASVNRATIADRILDRFFGLDFDVLFKNKSVIECVHNYINFSDGIIRKGSISAHAGEKLLIPLNMRDGTIVGEGLGNEDWNYSAPHGAGRLLSRSQAKKVLSLEEAVESMEGIYTTSLNKSTLDEAPLAYKDKDLIIEAVKDTMKIDFIMKPKYNFKAGE